MGVEEVVPINTTNMSPQNSRVANALGAEDPSVRLRAAMAIGSNPDPMFLESLVERCAVEPDFFVRDMLSWALTCLSPEITLPRIRQELDSERSQARSQALHTLSKVGDTSTWAWITRDMLRDADDEVARTAWRVAAALAPEDEDKKQDLVDELVLQLGRGDHSVQLSLSRALVDLGDMIEPALEKAAKSPEPGVAAHARMSVFSKVSPTRIPETAERDGTDRVQPGSLVDVVRTQSIDRSHGGQQVAPRTCITARSTGCGWRARPSVYEYSTQQSCRAFCRHSNMRNR